MDNKKNLIFIVQKVNRIIVHKRVTGFFFKFRNHFHVNPTGYAIMTKSRINHLFELEGRGDQNRRERKVLF